MNAEQFVETLKIVVHDAAIRDVEQSLERPPLRKPPESLAELSRWYRSLTQSDRERLRQVIRLSVHASVFGLLCVLDGVRAISDGGQTQLDLQAVEAGQRTPLNPGSGEMLHDLYQAQVYPEVFGTTAA
jgi:hypothetical protein